MQPSEVLLALSMARIDEQVETIVHDWKYSSEARPAIRDYLEYVSTYTFLAQTIIMEWVHQGRVGILVAASTPLSCRHYRAIKESGDRQGMTPDYFFSTSASTQANMIVQTRFPRFSLVSSTIWMAVLTIRVCS